MEERDTVDLEIDNSFKGVIPVQAVETVTAASEPALAKKSEPTFATVSAPTFKENKRDSDTQTKGDYLKRLMLIG